jgi:hypothetical protein
MAATSDGTVAFYTLEKITMAYRLKIIFIILGMILIMPFGSHPTASAAAILCVKPGGGSGCYAAISAALTASLAGDTIRVATGTYTENINLDKTITLEGGWDAAFSARDPLVNVTILNPADATLAVVTVSGQYGATSAVAPTIDGFTVSGAVSTNHGGGIRVQNSDAVIRNNIVDNNAAYLYGGGIWVQNGAPLIENNHITHNSLTPGGLDYGGGIELENTQATLNNNLIANNSILSDTGSGGGVGIDGGGLVTLTNNTLMVNQAGVSGLGGPSYGGGIWIRSANVNLDHNIIQDNVAANDLVGYGGGIDISGTGTVVLNGNTLVGNTASQDATSSTGYGGGISVRGETVTLTGNTIQGNTAATLGFGYGDGMYMDSVQDFTLAENTFSDNRDENYHPAMNEGGKGGGAYIASSSGTLIKNIFTANSNGHGGGGGLWSEASTLSIHGGQFADNISGITNACDSVGGGLVIDAGQVTLDGVRILRNCGITGSAIYDAGQMTMTNTVVANNVSHYAFNPPGSDGVGVFISISPASIVNSDITGNGAAGIYASSALTLTNSVISNHDLGVYIAASGSVSESFNDFFANTTQAQGFSLNPTDITLNPQWDAAFHLQSNSPLIDAGTRSTAPSIDMDGQPRPMAGTNELFRFDIGADEFAGPVQVDRDLVNQPADYTIIGPGGADDVVNGTNDWIGSAVMGSDVNGDGRPDLVVSAHDWAIDPNNSPFTPGRVFSLDNFGARRSGTLDLLTTPPDLTIDDRLPLQHLGFSLVGADLNGDGKADLIAGSSQDDGAGGGAVWPTVFAYWGGPALSGTRLLSDASPADFELRAPGQDFFAFSEKNALAAADLSGDGQADLIVGDALANDGSLANSGAVFVVFGGPQLSGVQDLAVTAADFTLYGPAAAAQLRSIATGRLNGDAQADLVARSDTTAYVIFGPRGKGVQHLSTTPANVTITGLQAGGVVVMDLTGDGQDDLILASGTNLYVIPGPLVDGQTYSAASHAILTLTGVAANLFAVGDVVGSSRPDLIVGDTTTKQAYVIPGGLGATGSVPLIDAAETVLKVPFSTALFSDLGVGDMDHDGRPDLLIGAGVDVSTHPAKYTDAGEVFVLYSFQTKIYLPLTRK